MYFSSTDLMHLLSPYPSPGENGVGRGMVMTSCAIFACVNLVKTFFFIMLICAKADRGRGEMATSGKDRPGVR